MTEDLKIPVVSQSVEQGMLDLQVISSPTLGTELKKKKNPLLKI